MKKFRLILVVLSVLILLGCISLTVFLLFSNYRNVRLFKQAQSNFQRGDEESLTLAETQLQQFICRDSNNEAAFAILGEIAKKRKWNAVWDKITTGILIFLMSSPILILVYIFMWFIFR